MKSKLVRLTLKQSKSRLELAIKLIIYSFIYGLILINWIDLIPKCVDRLYGYHLWLGIMYFIPFIIVLLIYGIKDWELVISLGILASLMNDLFYAPIGMIFGWFKVNLIEWYLWQLGFKDFQGYWYLDLYFIKIPVYSVTMGISIYLRIIIVTLLIWRWCKTNLK